jgi:hypothetical protein
MKKAFPLFLLIVFVSSIWMSMNRHSKWDYWFILQWDAEGYYLYLPAVVVNQTFENINTKTFDEYQNEKVFHTYSGTNKVFTKYTCGTALMQLPFFLIAHIVAYICHYPPDGYSTPYNIFVIIAAAFYLCAGLVILRKNLVRFFSEMVAFTCCIIVWLGTSMLYYSSLNPGYSHVYSFFLIGCLVYYTPVFFSKINFKSTIVIGLLLGLITLTRPANVVIMLYLLLYEVYSFLALKDRIILFVKNLKILWIIPFIIFVCWIPQFIYWKYISGNWLLYSYQEEGFIYWKNPKMISVLFHPQNGFFLYAPLMLLSILGLGLIWRKKVFSAPAIFVVFIVTDYLCGSWWYWNFGSAYGFRPYLDFLAVLAIPMAYFFSSVEKAAKSLQIATALMVVFLLFLSVRLTFIYHSPWQGPDWCWKDVLQKHKQALFIDRL